MRVSQKDSIQDFIAAKDDKGDNWSYKCAKLQSRVTSSKPTPKFLQAGCPSCCPKQY